MRRTLAVLLGAIILTLTLAVAALGHSAGHNACETQINAGSHGRVLDAHAPGWSHSMTKYGYTGVRFDPYDVVKRHYQWVGPPAGGYWKWQHSSATTNCFDWS